MPIPWLYPKTAALYALSALLPYLTAAYRQTAEGDWINQVVELQRRGQVLFFFFGQHNPPTPISVHRHINQHE
ncbi:MAG: hypothetical protein AB1652_05835 [Bacillota bacterium]